MSVHEVMVSHIAAAKSELLSERVKIDAALGDLDRLLQQYASQDSAGSIVFQLVEIGSGAAGSADEMAGTQRSEESGAPQMRDAIKDLVDVVGPIKADDAASKLADRYGWSKASVRSLLSKMAKAGELARRDDLGRGYYDDITRAVVAQVHPEVTGGEDAEAPADTGASDYEELIGNSSLQEGGTADGAEPSRGRGDHPEDSGWNHDYGHRASLVGGK